MHQFSMLNFSYKMYDPEEEWFGSSSSQEDPPETRTSLHNSDTKERHCFNDFFLWQIYEIRDQGCILNVQCIPPPPLLWLPLFFLKKKNFIRRGCAVLLPHSSLNVLQLCMLLIRGNNCILFTNLGKNMQFPPNLFGHIFHIFKI